MSTHNKVLIKAFEEKNIDTRDILALKTIKLDKEESSFIHRETDDVVYTSSYDSKDSKLDNCSVMHLLSDDKVKVYLNRGAEDIVLYEGVIKTPMLFVTNASRYEDIYFKGEVHITKYYFSFNTGGLFLGKEIVNKEYKFKHSNNLIELIEK